MGRAWILAGAVLGVACTSSAEPVAEAVMPAAERFELRPVTFEIAASRAGSIDLSRVGDELLVIADEVFHVDAQGGLNMLEEPRPADLEWKGVDLRGKPMTWRHDFRVAGRWPDALWMMMRGTSMERIRGPRAVFQRTEGRWVEHSTFDKNKNDERQEWYYAAILGWREGQVLGLRVPGERRVDGLYQGWQLGDMPPGARFEVLGEPGVEAWPIVDPRLVVITAAVGPGGELFALGYEGEDSEQAVVQRWDPSGPDGRAGVVDRLPGSATVHLLAVGAGGRAYVSGVDAEGTYLARFDGAGWSQEPVPEARRILDVSLAPGGVLWAVHEREDVGAVLVRRRAAGTWEQVALPANEEPEERWNHGERIQWSDELLTPSRVVALGDEDVWVVGEADRVDFLLHSGPRVAPRVEIGERRGVEVLATPAVAWRPGVPCTRERDPMAVLWDMSEGAAEDTAAVVKAFVLASGAVRSQIRGIYEYERWRERFVGVRALADRPRSERFIGVVIDTDIGAAQGRQLRAALKAAAPGQAHPLICELPRVVRAYDAATGEAQVRP